MEILFVSHKYPPAIGGMEKQSYELINGMRKYATVHTIIYDGKGNKLLFFASLQRHIVNICRQYPNISVVHFNDGLIAAVCSFHTGYKHLRRTVTLHGLDVVFPGKMFRKYVLPKFNDFDQIFTVSQATADACRQLGLHEKLLTVVPNGVDTTIGLTDTQNNAQPLAGNDFFTNRTRVFVAMGRPVKRKGFSWLIENVVPKLHGDFVVLFIGPMKKRTDSQSILLAMLPRNLQHKIALFLGAPTDERNIRVLLKTEALQNKVHHLGKLPFPEIARLLQRADYFLMPNIPVSGDMEGFGLVCLEAALCGATVIAANTDGIPDAVHNGKNGLLLPAGDVGAWVTFLNNLSVSPQAQKLTRRDVRNYTLENFGWDKMVHKYWQHLNHPEHVV